MDAQIANEQLTLTVSNKTMNNGDVNISQEEAAQRYLTWQATQKLHPKTDWDKAFDACRHLMPDWFLFSAMIVGVITLGLVMLKVNPLLAPIKTAVIWLLKLWESFLEKTNIKQP